MHKISQLTLVASLGLAGATTVAINAAPTLPVAQAASNENLALANRNIADGFQRASDVHAGTSPATSSSVVSPASSRSPTPTSTRSRSTSTTTSSSSARPAAAS